ncbi:SRPBCC domain-containing protein [uncultured Tateyamaria sp.]|uniref:SRPBCC domain-containing protein n=1 Tax=Tateyamaria sp. 1078 TaxID=3417464 RepID=UPI00260236FB|nr:SRPBCC domain-containing protein [uncultured Tateyamaria sp.]
MKTYETETDIAATPDVVWHVLTHVMPRTPAPFGIVRLEGTLEERARIKLWSQASPNRAFGLRVARFDAPHRMVWRGGLPLGLFTGVRTFTLTPAPGGARFSMREDFSGPLSAMIVATMPDLTPSFTTFAHTLKTKAEQV